MKIEEIAHVRCGLVLKRKENANGEHYSLLSARYIDHHGNINGYEEFYGDGWLDDYLTHEGDIIVKIAWPNVALYIEEENVDLLVSSYFFIVRCHKESVILPEYLSVFLNSDVFRDMIEHEYIGTTVKALKLSTLKNAEIPALSISRQREVIKVFNLAKKEKKAYESLLEKKDFYYRSLLSNMLGVEADES